MNLPVRAHPLLQRCLRFAIVLLLCVLCVLGITYPYCARHGDGWFAGDVELQQSLARGVERWLDSQLDTAAFTTGSKRFDGEWLFGTYMMAAMAFGQTALEQPDRREHYLDRMEQCFDALLSSQVKAFTIQAWGSDPIDSLDGSDDHAAYLGYFNIALSLHRMQRPHSRFAHLNDRITASLVRRLDASPLLLLLTYPHEVYPVDNCAVIASIALHARATGIDRSQFIQRWSDHCRSHYVDSTTGLLIQAVSTLDGSAIDAPRGSGTTLGAYFLGFGDMALSRELNAAVAQELDRRPLRFGTVREYPQGHRGVGDIDSGPIVLGYGLSATGFALGGARIHEQSDRYKRLFATAYLFGAPTNRGDALEFVSGGPLGNAIMFAMLTAPRAGIGEQP